MAQCLSPFEVRNKFTGDTIPVPCGKCPTCCARRTSAWSFRMMIEERVSTSAWFITLTYDVDHVPITKNGFMNLDKRDVQLFFKRLRKAHDKQQKQRLSYLRSRFKVVNYESPQPIKYYAVGEYGGITRRPHYHIILFNADVDLIESAWNGGHIHYGYVSPASAGYTLKYISKQWRPMHANDDRQPQFALMSKGLGKSYLTPQMVAWHKNDLESRMYCNLDDGKKISMPRYYKDRIYTEEERKRVAFFARIDMIARQAELENDPQKLSDMNEAKIAAFHLHTLTAAKADKI